ncbi:DMT family transporter [Actinomyces provencensis]|uniref:DMT family transporter n=1 Tax=Actinomyces provencensis TaxID=1720198 RepID=UPI00096A5DCF|nr:DMT family transporter [Actinomyces provencensis]
MKFGVLSGLLWGLDTVVLGIALGMGLFADSPDSALVGALLHDAACMIILFVYMAARGRLRDTATALRTRSGKVVMVGALLGGPIGMTGYLVAIDNIGPGYTAILSSFYPAVGTVLAVVFLKERMRMRQVIALAVALVAIMVMGWSSTGVADGGNALVGVVAAVVCMVGWGSEAVLLAWGMRDDAVDNETALQIRETTSALVYGLLVVPVAGALGTAWDFTFTAPTAVIALAAVAGTLSYLFYYKAIDQIGAARGMAVNISYSAWAVVFGIVFLGEIPGVLQVVCCVAIICGTVLSASADWKELRFWGGRARAADQDSIPA